MCVQCVSVSTSHWPILAHVKVSTLETFKPTRFIDIRLCPSVTTLLVIAGRPTWPTTAKCYVIHKTESTQRIATPPEED